MYKVKLEEFEGPLDLLLFLIKKNEIDIYDIPIAVITEQYLQYLELIELLDLDIAGEFLVMAATLMHIKSKMLLPVEERPADEQEEDDPRAELVRRLIEYKAFKEAADQFQSLEARQRDVFHRPGDMDTLQVECGGERYFEATLFDLISAFSVVLSNVPKETFFEVIKEHITVEQKIREILNILNEKTSFSVKSVFESSKSKIEVVVTFLALLELMKMHSIMAVQKELFGDIEIIKRQENGQE